MIHKHTSTTRRAPRGYIVKTHALTMIGYAAAWQARQQSELAARPAEATAQCACCDTTYAIAGLKPIDSEWLYERAAQTVSFERDGLVCKGCREDFSVEFGTEPADVYHIFDRNLDRAD